MGLFCPFNLVGQRNNNNNNDKKKNQQFHRIKHIRDTCGICVPCTLHPVPVHGMMDLTMLLCYIKWMFASKHQISGINHYIFLDVLSRIQLIYSIGQLD